MLARERTKRVHRATAFQVEGVSVRSKCGRGDSKEDVEQCELSGENKVTGKCGLKSQRLGSDERRGVVYTRGQTELTVFQGKHGGQAWTLLLS